MNSKKPNTAVVYNTLTGRYEEVALSPEVFQVYQRTEWNIKDQDESFFDHNIQFSGLIGGTNNNFENFREFIDVDSDRVPEKVIRDAMQCDKLRAEVSKLSDREKELIRALYIRELTEREYAEELGVSQPMIHKRKTRLLKKLKKFFE